MGAGGTVHVSYGQGGPGSDPIDPPPQSFEVPDLQDVLDPTMPDHVGRRLVDADGGLHAQKDAAYPRKDPDSGRYTSGDDGGWSTAFSSAGGWRPV